MATGKLGLFSVSLDQIYGVYYAGDTVTGRVLVNLSEPMKMRGIILKLTGKAYVKWTVHRNKSTHTYKSEENYFDQKFTLVKPETGDTIDLPAGQYSYPFRYKTSQSLPSSFEGEFGHVRYLAEAKIDRPWKFDHVTKTAFTVLRMLNLNNEYPILKQPFTIQQTKTVSCCCCLRGKVDATIKIERRCFVPGETIYISGEVLNQSNTTVNSIVFKLNQYVQYLGSETGLLVFNNTPRMKVAKQCLASIQRNLIEDGGSDAWNNMPLVVPAMPPSRLEGCKVIIINYKLKIKIQVECNNFGLESELIIGTIPLQSSYYNMPPSVGGIMLPPQAIVSQPTAVSFPNDGSQQLQSWAPPPPSYAECVKGKVQIKEEGDSDYIRGDLLWAPMYPTYFQQPLDSMPYNPQQQQMGFGPYNPQMQQMGPGLQQPQVGLGPHNPEQQPVSVQPYNLHPEQIQLLPIQPVV